MTAPRWNQVRGHLAIVTVGLLFTGCGSLQTFQVGIPAASATKLFFHVQKAAAEVKGVTISLQQDAHGPRVHVRTPSDGWVYFYVHDNEIWMALDPDPMKNGAAQVEPWGAMPSEEAMKWREAKLKYFGDGLIKEANRRKLEAGD